MRRLLDFATPALWVTCGLFLAASHAAAADADADGHAKGYQVQGCPVPIGRALVDLPVPPGFVEPSRSVPPLRMLGERMTPPTNRLLALFIAENDERDAREGRQPGMARCCMAQALRQTEEQSLGGDDFGAVKNMLRQQYQQLLGGVTGTAQGHLDWSRATTREWLPHLAAAN
jgi:hypothetical protein